MSGSWVTEVNKRPDPPPTLCQTRTAKLTRALLTGLWFTLCSKLACSKRSSLEISQIFEISDSERNCPLLDDRWCIRGGLWRDHRVEGEHVKVTYVHTYTWYSVSSWIITSEALMYGTFSRDLTVLPAHLHVHPQLEWAIPAFAFPATAGTHLPFTYTAESQPIWIKFCAHLLLYGIHLWADLNRSQHMGGSRPNQNNYVFVNALRAE